MKRISIVMVLAVLTAATFAQKKFINRAGMYISSGEFDKARTDIDSALKYEENKINPKLWVTIGNFYYEVFKANKTEFFSDGIHPLHAAVENYKKAHELDPMDKLKNEMILKLEGMYNNLRTLASEKFDAKEYGTAKDHLLNCLEIKKFRFYKGAIDTVVMFYAGATANLSKDYAKGLELMTLCRDMNYKGEAAYVGMKEAYWGLNDTANAIKILKEGMVKCDPNTNIIFELVNIYLITGISPQDALTYLKMAQEKEPTNVTLYWAEGNLNEKLNRPENAIASYEKAIKVDSTYFNAVFNIGAIHFNQGVDILNAAKDIPINQEAKYTAEMLRAEEKFKQALPYIEKAATLEPENLDCLRSLKEIYIRLKMNDKYNSVKQKLESLQPK